MSVSTPPDAPLSRPPVLPASRAQIADYLENQANDLEALAAATPLDPGLVAELAARFSTIALDNELTFVAERFNRLVLAMDDLANERLGAGTHGG